LPAANFYSISPNLCLLLDINQLDKDDHWIIADLLATAPALTSHAGQEICNFDTFSQIQPLEEPPQSTIPFIRAHVPVAIIVAGLNRAGRAIWNQ
jgi:hypothetical protein